MIQRSRYLDLEIDGVGERNVTRSTRYSFIDRPERLKLTTLLVTSLVQLWSDVSFGED